MRERIAHILETLSRPVVAIGGAVVIGGALLAYAWFSISVPVTGAFVPVAEGPITQTVDVSGQVQSAQHTDMAFQVGGRIAGVYVQVGDHVRAGQTLVALDGSSEVAAVAVAQANLETQKAKLAALVAGTRPEQLALDETAVTQAQTSLTNALTAAYAAADDAVHAKADQMFTNPRTQNATLALLVPDAVLTLKLENERMALGPMLVAWQQASTAEAVMRQVGAFLDDLAAALAEAQPSGDTTAAVLSGYQTSVQAGRTEVSTELAALVAADTALKNATGALALAKAGPTTNDTNAQQASVDAAAAAVQAAKAAAAKTVITAPIAGTITAQNANLGETAVPGAPLVSMIADGHYQADAQVSETDIAKLKVGETVQATFDAYPNVTFPATVTTVDPAATVQNGVASYGITVTFAHADARLVPGLTAHLHIVTATRADALLVPTTAIITDGTHMFVYVRGAHGTVKTPVTVGIASVDGMTAVLTGLAKGQDVLTFGSNATQS